MKICEQAEQDVQETKGGAVDNIDVAFYPRRRQDHSNKPKHERAGYAHRMSAPIGRHCGEGLDIMCPKV